MNLLSGLAAISTGVRAGLEDERREEDRQRRIDNEKADRAFVDEQRTQQRTQWTRSNEEADRQERIRQGLAQAGKPYEAEEIDLGMGDGGEPNTKGYRINGQIFGSKDDPGAKTLLAELNSPLGQARRLAQVYMREGDYQGAQKALADATRMTADSFNLDKIRREAEHMRANDELFSLINGEPGSDKFANAAALATRTQLFGLKGKEVRPEVTADGKRVVMGIWGEDGQGNMVREGALATYNNSRDGLLSLYADFAKGTPEQKIALMREAIAAQRTAADDERKGAKHEADLGLTAAHTKYYDAAAGAASAKATGGGANASLGLRERQFDAKEWNGAAKIDKATVSVPDEATGKDVESADLRLVRTKVFNEAKASGTMAPNEAAEHADTQVVRLKNLAMDRVAAARAADPKSRLTVAQEIRNILKAYDQAQRSTSAPAAAPTTPATAAKPAAAAPTVGLEGPPSNPVDQMSVSTLRRIAAIDGHVNQRAAKARLAQIESDNAAQVERMQLENPHGFGLVPN